jgi:hypothetical protein
VKEKIHGEEIWKHWASDEVGFIAHKSTMTLSDHACYWWSAAMVPTKWGDISLVRAEQILYEEGLSRYPNASWFCLVSETCIPVWSCDEFLSMLSRNKSVFQIGRHPTGFWSHQWKILSRKHAQLAADAILTQECW